MESLKGPLKGSELRAPLRVLYNAWGFLGPFQVQGFGV